jgi:hypothetical protein
MRTANTKPVNAGGSRLLKRHLLAGAAALALLASGSTYALHAYSAESSSPFGARSAAQAPVTPAAIPGFTDLVAAVKPAVVSVRVRAALTEAALAAFIAYLPGNSIRVRVRVVGDVAGRISANASL